MDDAKSPAELSLVDLATLIESSSRTPGDDIAAIRHADALTQRSRERLHELVASARGRGASWQAIGDALGVSRQATFKRFGHLNDVDSASTEAIDLIERTNAVFGSLDAGNDEVVRSLMTYTCARALSKRTLAKVWNEVVAESGRLEDCTDPTVRTPDGRTVVSRFLNRHLNTGAIVQTTLRHERGQWIGRVAYNGTGKITGVLIARPGTTSLPF